jgi:hypothetical protein
VVSLKLVGVKVDDDLHKAILRHCKEYYGTAVRTRALYIRSLLTKDMQEKGYLKKEE